jgi:hypothetical protein
MKNPDKLRAKLGKAADKVEATLEALRAQAKRKITRIEHQLAADEARITSKYEAKRAKIEGKLTAVEKRARAGDGKAARPDASGAQVAARKSKPARRRGPAIAAGAAE